MNHEFGPEQLAAAIAKSRSLVPKAVDILCDLITEVTGTAPSRSRVEYVSLFWLMHVCDRISFDEFESSAGLEVNPEELNHGSFVMRLGKSRRSQFLSMIGSRTAPVRVVDPYLKSGLTSEAFGAFGLRHLAQWSTMSGLSSIDFPRSDVVSPRQGVSVGSGQRRELLGDSASHSDVSGILRRRVIASAPASLVEHHHAWSNWARSIKNRRTKVIYTANAHQSSIPFRNWAYEERQRGTTIAVHQHGGGYGIDDTHFGEDHDIATSDIFYTFGWVRPELGARVRPLPSAMPQRSSRGSGPDMLLMSLPVTTRFYRLQPFLLPNHISIAVEQTVDFVKGLAPDFGIRIRSSGSDRFPIDRLSGASVHVSTDTSNLRGSVAASRAKLVIHNYLGTSWLETLAMDVPTVCFYDRRMFRPRAAAQPFIDAMANVGIIHYSGREAADFVNSLRGNPSSWWRLAEVQEAREAFVARYANFSENWLEAWQAEFESLLAE